MPDRTGAADRLPAVMFQQEQGANDIVFGCIEALFPSDEQKTALVSVLWAFANVNVGVRYRSSIRRWPRATKVWARPVRASSSPRRSLQARFAQRVTNCRNSMQQAHPEATCRRRSPATSVRRPAALGNRAWISIRHAGRYRSAEVDQPTASV